MLVEDMKKDGAKLIERLILEGVEVISACWLKESDGPWWHLYLATPLVSNQGELKPAFRKIHEVQRGMSPQPTIDVLTIKVVNPDSPIARAIARVHQETSGRSSYLGEGGFGGVGIDAGYVYAPFHLYSPT